jgi:hypothetical protein
MEPGFVADGGRYGSAQSKDDPRGRFGQSPGKDRRLIGSIFGRQKGRWACLSQVEGQPRDALQGVFHAQRSHRHRTGSISQIPASGLDGDDFHRAVKPLEALGQIQYHAFHAALAGEGKKQTDGSG